MGYALHREVDDRELLFDDDDAEGCPHCGGEEVNYDGEGHPICGECKSPLFVNDDPQDEGDDDADNADAFADYLEELESEMGDGDE